MRRLFTCPTCHRTAKVRLAPVGCVCGHMEHDIESLPEIPEAIPQAYVMTVGMALGNLISHRYGVSGCTACKDLAREMDRLGPGGCRRDIARLACKLKGNALRLNWHQIIEAAAHPVSSIGAVVDLSRRKIHFFQDLILEAIETVENSDE